MAESLEPERHESQVGPDAEQLAPGEFSAPRTYEEWRAEALRLERLKEEKEREVLLRGNDFEMDPDYQFLLGCISVVHDQLISQEAEQGIRKFETTEDGN